MSTNVSLEVLYKLIQIFSLLFVWNCWIVETKSEALHGSILEMAPKEVRNEKGETLKQEEQADPLVVRLKDDVVFLVDWMVRSDTWKINEVANNFEIGTTPDILKDVKIRFLLSYSSFRIQKGFNLNKLTV
jgi:hypothetical protein